MQISGLLLSDIVWLTALQLKRLRVDVADRAIVVSLSRLRGKVHFLGAYILIALRDLSIRRDDVHLVFILSHDERCLGTVLRS